MALARLAPRNRRRNRRRVFRRGSRTGTVSRQFDCRATAAVARRACGRRGACPTTADSVSRARSGYVLLRCGCVTCCWVAPTSRAKGVTRLLGRCSAFRVPAYTLFASRLSASSRSARPRPRPAFGHCVWCVSARGTSAFTCLPWRLAQRHIPPSGTMMVVPSWVKEYSTATVIDLMMRRAINPVDSRLRRVLVSIR